MIEELVHKHYWINDNNCAITTMSILSKYFDFKINQQTFDSLIGLNGAGKYGSQCGLVEGTLMFIGIIGKQENFSTETIENLCRDFAHGFEMEKDSILCKDLRPLGFSKDNSPHLCEKLTVESIHFSIDFIKNKILTN